ncbi:mitochondrial ribosomal protein subunit L33 [Schizosaccharomyces pombe]|uniref:Large ribosomal subunit protein bL33m n=1 Tax=Schizosaccharomyces pombe (strain 972 / ATCC 24843) TaxID=284812 RepID=RM39_SCHPO|nr:putative mitochondrial ribosomal protein subunit L39 [Schizosaccharomyces pombe]O74394.1 RecName: Full=Large ribosomal subunit protein bL33m; AltName: Full=54S ribosomal protein L39, mitochondrial [Schizosaccharomyces pombe 972h-]CAA20728.1 mitochondrial ribosomal protein subunit L39 (predicted) [Schizosaccharomyces pombe]|eukprot:NP_596108.1 putative mitochondrial ribosomal protein subunit L39 [Schizosaccharomyces pombe]
MAKKNKARLLVKLLSTAGTGFFYVRSRPKAAPKLAFIKYDPKIHKRVLFEESKMK